MSFTKINTLPASESKQDLINTLYVNWTLTHSYNYQYADCETKVNNEYTVFSLERLLAIAYKILEIPKNAFYFHFTGGEPTLHPQLLELLSYLFNAGRKVSATIDTNCSQNLDYYRNLSVSLPARHLDFNLHVHPAHSDPDHIFSLVSNLVESGHNILIIFHQDEKQKKKSDYLYSGLCALKQKILFNLTLAGSDQPDKNQIVSSMESEFAKSAQTGPACQPAGQPLPNIEVSSPFIVNDTSPASTQANEDFQNCFCCTGSNLLRIEPDGGFYGSCCDVTLRNQPLWRQHSAVKDALQIIQCPIKACPGGINNLLPKFDKRDEAQAFLEESHNREKQIKENSRPPLAPSSSLIQPDLYWAISVMLREMTPAGSDKNVEAFPDLAAHRIEDIVKVYEFLADEDSKNIFLAGIKAITTGNAGFLPNSAYAPFRHPKVNEDAEDVVFADASGMGNLFQLPEKAKLADLEEARGKLYQLKPKIQLALSLHPDSFLAVPLWLLEYAPGYEFYLGSHPESEETILYGRHPQKAANLICPESGSGAIPSVGEALRREVRHKLDNLPLLRKTVKTIDPSKTVIVTFGAILGQACEHYKAMNLQTMPIFVLADWDEADHPEWQTEAKKYGINIKRLKEMTEEERKNFCLYAKPDAEFWKNYCYQKLFEICRNLGFTDKYLVDSVIIDAIPKRSAKKEYVKERFSNICSVFKSLEDDDSRNTFLRVIKSMETGDAGYLSVALYDQYWHPKTRILHGETLVEGGIASGYTTINFAQVLGEQGRIYAFEPLAQFFQDCSKKFSAYDQICLEPFGLWSCEKSFYIKNGGGGSQLVSAPGKDIEECHTISIDDYLKNKDGKCDCIKLDIEGSEMECLLGAMKTIQANNPKMHISLYHLPNHYLDIPLWLLRNFPNYKLYMGHHGPWFYETVLYALPDRAKSEEKTINFSVIVPSAKSENNIRRALDSILLQDVEGLEVIILNDGSSSSATKIVYEYAQRYPKVLRPLRVNINFNTAPGEALNSALDRASGKYVAFLDPDNMLAEDFLANGLKSMEEQDADIVAFNTVYCLAQGREIYSPQQFGIFAGLDALAMLGDRAESVFCLYRTEFLRKYNIRFDVNYVSADLCLPVQAFYWSAKTVSISQIGAYVYEQIKNNTGNSGSAFKTFANFCDFLTDFFVSNGLDPEIELYAILIRQEYVALRDRIFQEISAAQNNRTLAGLLAKDRLLKIGRARPALELMIKEFAELHCWHSGVSPIVAFEDLDWRKAAAQPNPNKTYSAYGNADMPSSKKPELSVIVPNYNKAKYIPQCLDSILSQSRKDFEVIIVDDASTDESWDILRQFADANPRIRLYRMDTNCRQGICRNLGMDKARGKYLTFVDSDDFLEPGFFAHGLKIIKESNADIAFFSLKWRKDIEQIRAQIQEDAVMDPNALYEMFINRKIEPAPYAKIIRTDVARLSGARFEEYIYHQDQFFIWPLIKNISKAATSEFMAYQVNLSENSTIRPASRKYLNLRSACEFINLLDNIATEAEDNLPGMVGHCRWNLENVLLYTQKAFLDECGELALTSADYKALGGNFVFLKALLEGYALCREKGNIPEGLIPQRRSTWEDYAYTGFEKPLISVIVPTYNQEGPIGRCLESILSQNLRSLEIIIVNDASTDHTLAVSNAYAAKDGRIRVISNETNRAQGYSRNRAMKMSKGKYITFIDSDDYIIEGLQYGVAQLNQNLDVDFIQFGHSENDEKELIRSSFKQNLKISGDEFFKLYLEGKLTSWNALAKIIRKDFLLDNNLFFPEHFFEDAIFILAIYGKAKNVIVDDRIIYMQIRTLHEASTMKPIKWTKRHFQGYLARVAWVSKNIGQREDLENAKKYAYDRIKYAYGFPQLLNYIASFKGSVFDLFSQEDKYFLNNTPELCNIIIENFTKLWIEKNKPKIEFDSMDMAMNPPADHILHVAGKAHDNIIIPISIIIPAYNVESYLSRCLDSVLHQNLQNMEIILIEDCSTKDNTFSICKEYANAYNNIRLYKTPWNSGLGVVRNLGMSVARGEYLTFLDSDDAFVPGFLSKALARLENNPCDIASFNIREDRENGSFWFCKPEKSVSAFMASYDHLLGKYWHWEAWGRIFRRSFIEDAKLSFSSLYFEDNLFMLQAYASSSNHWYMDINSVIYERKRPDSIMNKQKCDKKYFDSIIHNLVNILSIFDNYSSNEKQILTKAFMETNLCIGSRFWKYFLGYIYAYTKEKLSSPVTDEVIDKLCKSGEFMPHIFRKYAEFYIDNK